MPINTSPMLSIGCGNLAEFAVFFSCLLWVIPRNEDNRNL